VKVLHSRRISNTVILTIEVNSMEKQQMVTFGLYVTLIVQIG